MDRFQNQPESRIGRLLQFLLPNPTLLSEPVLEALNASDKEQDLTLKRQNHKWWGFLLLEQLSQLLITQKSTFWVTQAVLSTVTI